VTTITLEVKVVWVDLVVFASHHFDIEVRFFKSLYKIFSVAPLYCLHAIFIVLLSETLTRFYFDADVIAW
jgi:hypothetical protein